MVDLWESLATANNLKDYRNQNALLDLLVMATPKHAVAQTLNQDLLMLLIQDQKQLQSNCKLVQKLVQQCEQSTQDHQMPLTLSAN